MPVRSHLNLARSRVQHSGLSWHYRCPDESLIAFSNHALCRCVLRVTSASWRKRRDDVLRQIFELVPGAQGALEGDVWRRHREALRAPVEPVKVEQPPSRPERDAAAPASAVVEVQVPSTDDTPEWALKVVGDCLASLDLQPGYRCCPISESNLAARRSRRKRTDPPSRFQTPGPGRTHQTLPAPLRCSAWAGSPPECARARHQYPGAAAGHQQAAPPASTRPTP
jgi:hypothetical protein